MGKCEFRFTEILFVIVVVLVWLHMWMPRRIGVKFMEQRWLVILEDALAHCILIANVLQSLNL